LAFYLSKRSQERLSGVHADLQQMVRSAILTTEVDFAVLEGKRSLAKQKQLFQTGASQTMNSRHLTGHAVDLGAWVGGEIRWDWPLYHQIAKAMNVAAFKHNITLEWGGNWKSFPDGPHFQLSWKDYPL